MGFEEKFQEMPFSNVETMGLFMLVAETEDGNVPIELECSSKALSEYFSKKKKDGSGIIYLVTVRWQDTRQDMLNLHRLVALAPPVHESAFFDVHGDLLSPVSLQKMVQLTWDRMKVKSVRCGCGSCGHTTEHIASSRICSLPAVLVVKIERSTSRFSTPLSVRTRQLDLSVLFAGSSSSSCSSSSSSGVERYNLLAFTQQLGLCDPGTYCAAGRSANGQMLYRFDGKTVRGCSFPALLRDDSVSMLFFVRDSLCVTPQHPCAPAAGLYLEQFFERCATKQLVKQGCSEMSLSLIVSALSETKRADRPSLIDEVALDLVKNLLLADPDASGLADLCEIMQLTIVENAGYIGMVWTPELRRCVVELGCADGAPYCTRARILLCTLVAGSTADFGTVAEEGIFMGLLDWLLYERRGTAKEMQTVLGTPHVIRSLIALLNPGMNETLRETVCCCVCVLHEDVCVPADFEAEVRSLHTKLGTVRMKPESVQRIVESLMILFRCPGFSTMTLSLALSFSLCLSVFLSVFLPLSSFFLFTSQSVTVLLTVTRPCIACWATMYSRAGRRSGHTGSVWLTRRRGR
jgi:hypothetical protein